MWIYDPRFDPPVIGGRMPGVTATTLLETRVGDVGRRLASSGRRVLAELPDRPEGPILFAKALGINKATASRMLRALASDEPIATVGLIPGPDPLRAFAAAARRRGVTPQAVADFAGAVDAFDDLIRAEAGDRSGLDAVLTAWLPEARETFELQRKQAVFRNLSQLRGKLAKLNLATALLHPSPGGEHLDVVWVHGHLGLQRLRPGIPLNFTSRRVPASHGPAAAPLAPRRPLTLDGVEAADVSGLLLPECCSRPLPDLLVEPAGDRVHYLLAGDDFGPRSAADVVFAEVNRAELPRYVALEPRRKRFVYVDVAVPTERLVFDLLIHRDVLGATEPGLAIYDTASRGVADVNDPSRDLDRLDVQESLRPLGAGLSRCRLAEAAWYAPLLSRVCGAMAWRAEEMRAYRLRVDYPLYGSQFVLTYDAQAKGQAKAQAAPDQRL